MAGYEGVSAAELDDLKAQGFREGEPNTIPKNISPVLKSKLLQAMGYPGDGSSPNAQDQNPPDGHETGLTDGKKPAKTSGKASQQDATANADTAKSKK